MLLVDSSVWIDHFNGYESPQAGRLARALADQVDLRIVVPGVILSEILCGLRAESEVLRIAALFEGLDQVPEPGTADYIAAAKIFRTCRNKGESVRSLIDCLIAQICMRHDCRLLSRDRDFEKIARYFPLAIEAV